MCGIVCAFNLKQKTEDLRPQILEMAKEKREWFRDEDYAHLDALIEETKKELEAAESAYEKTKEDFTRITVQMMLKTFSEQQ